MKQLPVLRHATFFALLFLAGVFLYGGFLQNPLVFDDQAFFALDSLYRHFLEIRPDEIRWLPTATIVWTGQYLGLNIVWLRLESLLLHVAVAISLFVFLHYLFDFALGKSEQGGVPNVWMAFFGALLFLVHPVVVYGAAYLIQRTIVMATLFSVLSLYVYLRGLIEDRTGLLWGAVVLYTMAILSKEHAIMLPTVMLALTLLYGRVSRELVKRLWRVYVGLFLVASYVLMQKAGLFGTIYEIAAPEILDKLHVEHAYALSILTQSTLFFKYWLLWLLPNPQWLSIDMREPFAESLFSIRLIALLVFIAYGVAGGRLLLNRGRTGLLGFAMLFPWLLFFTEFSTVRVQESFVLYRSYLWIGGIFAALPFLMSKFDGRRAFIGVCMTVLLFSAFSVNRLTVFSHSFLLWDDALELVRDRGDLPGVARIYYNRGVSLTSLRRYEEALADHKKALEMEPVESNLYATGAAYMNVAEYGRALELFERTLEINPRHVQAKLGRGLCHLELGEFSLARGELDQSCKEGFKIACEKLRAIESNSSAR